MEHRATTGHWKEMIFLNISKRPLAERLNRLDSGLSNNDVIIGPSGKTRGYNPLACVRYDERRQRYSEQDILTISAALAPIEDFQQPFGELAAKKTVVFLNVSDTAPSNYRLANLFYTQALHTLCGIADKRPAIG